MHDEWRSMSCESPPGRKPWPNGYVYFERRIGGVRVTRGAHQIAFEECFGPPPADKPFILHHCDNRACWQPLHLFAGTAKDNAVDAASKGRLDGGGRRMHCKRGHDLTPENTRVTRRGGRVERQCRTCFRNRPCRAALLATGMTLDTILQDPRLSHSV